MLLGRWVLARLGLARQLRQAQPLHASLGPVADSVAAPVRPQPPVLAHASLGPLVAGVWRPRIVLPAALVHPADPESLAFILAHEAAHVARRDHWLVALVQLAVIVAWPVLPLWLAARQIRGLCELACDERVLAGRSRRATPALWRIVAGCGAGRAAPGARRLSPSFVWDLRTRLLALRRFRRWGRAGQLALVGLSSAVLFACSGAPGELPGDPVAPASLMSVAPPATAAHAPATGPVLTIDEGGGLWLQRRTIAPATLESELRAALRASSSQTLLIRGPKSVMLASAVDVMSAAKRAWATSINILTGPRTAHWRGRSRRIQVGVAVVSAFPAADRSVADRG